VKEWANRDEGRYYGAFEVPWIKYVEPDYLDPDTDGDGMLDAEDDQDRDDVPNFSELDIRCSDGLEDPQPEANVHPYNPCAPHGSFWYTVPAVSPMSRSCPRYKPVE
jgi:hypothetical protein